MKLPKVRVREDNTLSVKLFRSQFFSLKLKLNEQTSKESADAKCCFIMIMMFFFIKRINSTINVIKRTILFFKFMLKIFAHIAFASSCNIIKYEVIKKIN